MGLLDRLRSYLNDDDARPAASSRYDGRYDARGSWNRATAGSTAAGAARGAQTEDERAVERYRYLLRTATPDQVEEVHAEAFAKLTPEQRRLVFEDLSRSASASDRPADDDPRTLARSATRAEMRQPGFLERTFGGRGGTGRSGAGLGTIIGGSLLGTVAGVVIGSAIADMVLPGIGDLATDIGSGVQDLGQDVSDGFGDLGDSFGDFGDFGGGGDF